MLSMFELTLSVFWRGYQSIFVWGCHSCTWGEKYRRDGDCLICQAHWKTSSCPWCLVWKPSCQCVFLELFGGSSWLWLNPERMPVVGDCTRAICTSKVLLRLRQQPTSNCSAGVPRLPPFVLAKKRGPRPKTQTSGGKPVQAQGFKSRMDFQTSSNIKILKKSNSSFLKLSGTFEFFSHSCL